VIPVQAGAATAQLSCTKTVAGLKIKTVAYWIQINTQQLKLSIQSYYTERILAFIQT